MEIEQVIKGDRFRILKEVTKQKQSAASIAKTLKSSIPNVNQHLNLLEAWGFVDKEKVKQPGMAGKPKNVYTIKKEFTFIINFTKKKVQTIKGTPSFTADLLFNILRIPDPEDHFFLTKFCYKTEDIFKKCDGIAYMKSDKENVELILFTEDLEKIRKEYSNVVLENDKGQKKKIICWTHNEFELKDGLARKEGYYLNLLKNIIIIFDKTSKPEEIKKLRDELT